MRFARVLFVVLAFGLAAAPGAPAAKGDRADARAFAKATKQFRAGVLAQKEALETGVNRLTRDPVCLEALRHVPRDDDPYSAAVAVASSTPSRRRWRRSCPPGPPTSRRCSA